MRILLVLVFTLASVFTWAGPQTEFVVAKDGKGDFSSLQAAINAIKSFPDYDITIYIKNGIYEEKVKVHEWNTRLSLVGESADNTVIVWGDYFDQINLVRNSTFHTATVQVDANDFTARNLTIKNSAGEVGQALALAVNGNLAVFDSRAGTGMAGGQCILQLLTFRTSPSSGDPDSGWSEMVNFTRS